MCMHLYAIFPLIPLGILLYFYDEIKVFLLHMRSNYKEQILYVQGKLPKRKRKLKDKIKALAGKKRYNIIGDSYAYMAQTLQRTGEKSKIKTMRIISLSSGAMGVFISIRLGSVLLLPILGVGLALIPMWLIKFNEYRYKLRMQNELSVILSMVTNSYTRTENIVKAVEENLHYMNAPVKSSFESFVYSCKMVSPNIVNNLYVLKDSIRNGIFHVWCDNLIMCQKDINQKYALNAVVEQFTTERDLFNMLSSEISKPMRYLLIILVLSLSAFPISNMLGQQFGVDTMHTLFNTMTGQCIIVGFVLNLLFSINTAINVSTQID